MSQPSAKNQKSKKIKLVAQKPRKIRAALNSWIEASDQLDSDPLGLDDAPPWVENVWAEVVKVAMPSNRLPTSGEWDLELLGELFGRLQAFGKLFEGEIPVGPEVLAEMDRWQKFAATQPKSPARTATEKKLARDLQVRVNAVQHSIPDLIKAVMTSSHEDSMTFKTGLLRGENLSSDELISANVFERHTRTFFVLALFWRFWVTCKSLSEVYDYLCRSLGEKQIGSFKTFERHVAGKIGMKLCGPGRPSGKN